MTLFDIGVPALAIVISGGLYLYLLRERRRLHASKARDLHPAE